MSAKYKSPSFLLPNEINTSANTANDTGINSLYSMDFDSSSSDYIDTQEYLYGPYRVDQANRYNKANFSVSLWIKPDSTQLANWQYYTPISAVTTHGNGLRTRKYGNSTGYVVISGSAFGSTKLDDGNWHHLVCVFTSSDDRVKIYVDGNTTPEVNTTIASYEYFNRNTIIGQKGNSSEFFPGLIDEVAIFNRALDSTEIAALYGGTSPNIYPSNIMATDLNPIAYYPLGEQAQNSGYPSATGNEWQFPNGVLQDYVMDFDGGDNINSEANISSVSSFTASIWINRDDSATQYIYGQWVDGTSASQSWVIQTVGGIVYFNIRDASLNVKSAISTTSLTTGVWYNIIAVWTGSNIKLYINNSLEDTTACSSMNNPSTAVKLAIGSSSNNVSPFNGKISNAVIWNSDQESNRDNIYNNGSPQTTYTVTPQNWWKLNADSVYTPSAPNYTKALDFDSSQSDYIDLGTTTAYDTGDLSAAIWVNISNTGGAQYVFSNSGSPSIKGFDIKVRQSNQIGVSRSSQLKSSTSGWVSVGFQYDVWQHLAFTFNYATNTIKLFLNGELKDTSIGVAESSSLASAKLTIGSYKGVQSYANGKLSNAVIFNSTLTSSQVSTLFNFGTPETNISFNPQAWWKLDDQNAITDSSGNGNTGTNNGATDISSGVAVIPSWKIPSALTIPTINYTTAGSFNGTSSKVDIASTSLGTSNTISLWFYWPSSGNNTGTFIGGSTTTNPGLVGGRAIAMVGTGIYFSFDSAAFVWTNPWFATGNIRGDNWNHIVIVRDASQTMTVGGTTYDNKISLSINNSTLDTPNARYFGTPNFSTQTNIANSIGQSFSGTSIFEGFISNISTFTTAFTQAQVNTLYNNGQPSADISSLSPVNWWKLDTIGATITDNGSAGNNGTNTDVTAATTDVKTSDLNVPVNGVSTTLPSTALQQSDLQFDSPYSNYSLSFDGSTNFIDCGANENILDFSGNDYTVSTWVNWDGTGDANQMIASVKSGGIYVDFVLSIQQSTGKIIYWNGSTQVFSNSAIPTNAWCMVTIIIKAGQKDFFINGVADGTPSQARSAAAASGTSFLIGKSNHGSEFFNGKIDETSIFNYELTEAQVLEIYNNGRPKDLSTFSGTAPISWWRLGENAYFDNNSFVVPNSITGAPNGTGSGSITTMISADAPGTYANGIGTNLDILDRVGDAPLSTSNSQSYNMIPSDISPYVPGYVGNQIANNYSMSFDSASSDYIDVGNITALNNLSSFSSSSWFKCTTVSTAPVILNGGSSSTNRLYLQLLTNGTTIRYVIGSSVIDTSVSNIADGNWHHIATTQNGTSLDIYLDGVKQNTSTITVVSPSTNIGDNFKIGRYFLSAANYFDGLIDEVAIFDKALTADQIKFDLYQPSLPAGSNKTADIENNTNLPTPVAWYRMGD